MVSRLDPWGLAWDITETQCLHYNERNSKFGFSVDVGKNAELVAKPLKGHTFDSERASKILKQLENDKDGLETLRKRVAAAYDEKGYCDKVRLRRLGRALRLAGAIGAIAAAADSRLPEAATAYVNAKTEEEKMAAAIWVASEAANAGMTEAGGVVVYGKLMK